MLISTEYISLYTHENQAMQIIDIFFEKYIQDNPMYNKSNDIKMKYTIVDATAGIGGNSLFFCKYFNYVYCVDIYDNVINYLENNLKQYENKFIINENCLDILKIIKYDVIFFDPPWGGSSYKRKKNINLYINNKNIINIINELYYNKELKIIGLKVPINFNFNFIMISKWNINSYDIYKNDNKYILFKFIVFTK